MHRSLILNFDQTPLGFTSPSKVTFMEINSQNVPIAKIDDKRTIIGTFTVSLDGQFLPTQLIYTGKTDKCHPRMVLTYPRSLVKRGSSHITFE